MTYRVGILIAVAVTLFDCGQKNSQGTQSRQEIKTATPVDSLSRSAPIATDSILRSIRAEVETIDQGVSTYARAEVVTDEDFGNTATRYTSESGTSRIDFHENYETTGAAGSYYLKDGAIIYVLINESDGVDCWSPDSCPGGMEYRQTRILLSNGRIVQVLRKELVCPEDPVCPQPIDSLPFQDVTNSTDLAQQETQHRQTVDGYLKLFAE